VQQANRLLTTNWLLATDGKNVGLVPVNYIKRADPVMQSSPFPVAATEEPHDLTMEPVLLTDDEAIKSESTC